MSVDSLRRCQRNSLIAVIVTAVMCMMNASAGIPYGGLWNVLHVAEAVAPSGDTLSTCVWRASRLKSRGAMQRGILTVGEERSLPSTLKTMTDVCCQLRDGLSLLPLMAWKSSRFEHLDGLVERATSELRATTRLHLRARTVAVSAAPGLNSSQFARARLLAQKSGMRGTKFLDDGDLTSDQAYAVAIFISVTIMLLLVAAMGSALVYRRVAKERLKITESRNNQYLGCFVEQVKDYAVFTMDDQRRVTSWNQGVEAVLGFGSHEFIGREITALIYPRDVNAGELPSIETNGKPCVRTDRWVIRKSGQQFRASVSVTAVGDEHNRVIGYCVVMQDLTGHTPTEDVPAKPATGLSEKDRRMDKFLGTLAHDLRNPLAPIKNAVQLLGLSKLDPPIDALRQIIERQVDQLVRVIDDLADVSRMSQGNVILRKETAELKTVIDAAVEASATFIAERGQTLTVKLNHDTPIFVDVDPLQLTQVVSSLLGNSAKYSAAGALIELCVGLEDQLAVISVRDHGVGIQPHRLETIFQMTAGADEGLTRDTPGLGLGLAQVKNLVELHAGTISAASNGAGEGSVFTVRIPALSVSTQKPSAAAMEETPKPVRSFRVLVVEDMRAHQIMMTRLLRKLGHEVDCAENGAQALQKIEECVPEVIVSDISMPDMSGYDLARKIRRRADLAGIYLVALTGFSRSTDREMALEAGFNEHMVKPVELAALMSLFERLSS